MFPQTHEALGKLLRVFVDRFAEINHRMAHCKCSTFENDDVTQVGDVRARVLIVLEVAGFTSLLAVRFTLTLCCCSFLLSHCNFLPCCLSWGNRR